MEPIPRPKPGDYPAYHGAYLLAAHGDDLAGALRHAGEEETRTRDLVPDNRWEHRYAPGKWTTKEVLQHIIDTERVFSYRALCIARGEQANLPGMDEDAYQAQARTAARDIEDIMRELAAVRRSTVELFHGFDAQALACNGTANGKHITVPALGWIIAGHSEHHLRIIRERYLA
ncbi:MAG: DinB family protein [Flavobacteriales bacterium]|nr:DinB family protein [Flavobacteriales bacterium]MBP9081129.1 DinB family protein [Flavobacteriales bacterium]